jgi:hypothetical protein
MKPPHDEVRAAGALLSLMAPLLAGHPPGVQGAVLMLLLAKWLAGHAPVLRSRILELHVASALNMVPVYEREIFGEAGHPLAGLRPMRPLKTSRTRPPKRRRRA